MFKFRKILVPSDFSEPFNNALNYAVELAKSMDAEIIVIHVVEPIIYPSAPAMPVPGMMNYEREIEDSSKRELDKIIKRLGGKGVRSKGELLFGNPAAQIIEYAEKNKISLICISTHGRSGIEHLLFGSTTEKVLRKAPCPVLTVRQPPEKEINKKV